MIRIARLAAAAVFLLALEALCASGAAAQGTGDTRSIQVTANVAGACRFDTTPNINFGNLDPSAAADKTQQVDIAFKCTKGMTYTLTVGDGLNFSGGRNQMSASGGGTDVIPYDITPKTIQGTGKGFNVSDTLQISGTVRGPDFTNVSAGAYADTVTLSIQP